MTDISYPITANTGYEYAASSLPQSVPVAQHQRHNTPLVDGIQEDDGLISCICGYQDDDGWTVQCDSCNRWQHQLCYYPNYEDQSLPEDLQHDCIDCHPRAFDVQGARARQTIKREEQASLVNGVRRPAPKNHKKKVKDSSYANGWPLDKSRHDRNSASPRDQPPPAKRPKTSHRPSDSVTATSTKGHSRKRNASNVNHRRSLSHSPGSPIDYYSEHFMRCYLEDDWGITNVNLYSSLGITDALSDWLGLPEDEFRETHGHEKTEVLMRWDGDLEDIPGKAQLDIQELHDDRVKDEENNHPTWKMVTVQESIASGAYIGELKGTVGFKEEYQHDAANRWSLLRHPEPFVFFHPRLPIYIDARHEGTELRYVRRSCVPNARLQILVTDNTEYRFCFMATQQIDPGMEVAVGWDTSVAVPELMRRSQHVNGMSDRDIEQLSAWVSTVLANCGPCACQLQESDCMMSRFDKRGVIPGYEEETHSVKLPKPKKKKSIHNMAPLNTHLSSRSGSEARRNDNDDDASDSRSGSGSAGRGSASRDITPNTHYSHNGSLSAIPPELSERERKKLAKEEEMFRRQEEQMTGKSVKKKRNSGGSNLNTPNATSSKQFDHATSSKYADAGTSKQSGLPTPKPAKRSRPSTSLKTPIKPSTKPTRRPKLEYVDSGTQCDLDGEEERACTPPSPVHRRPVISLTQRLLQRCALNNARRQGPAAVARAERAIKESGNINIDPLGAKVHVPTAELPEPEPLLSNTASDDTEMRDADAVEQTLPTVQLNVNHRRPSQDADQEPSSSPEVLTHLPMEPAAPPWPSSVSHTNGDTTEAAAHLQKSPSMHLQMPPPPATPFGGASTLLSADTPSGLIGSLAQSPMSLNASSPMFSPAVNAALGPSPAKKKMSLSDYTKRSKATKETETRSERDSSPASVASGPVVPSLPGASSNAVTIGESTSAVDDDVKMEDVDGASAAA